MKRQALAWAMSVAGKRANALLAGESMSDQLVAEWAKADELVLSKLRERLGFGELRWALSERRRSSRRRSRSSQVSASQSPRFGECRS